MEPIYNAGGHERSRLSGKTPAALLTLVLVAAGAGAGAAAWTAVATGGASAPVLRAVTTWPTSRVGATAGASVPLPSGVQAGDLLLAQVSDQGPATQVMSPPSGWSPVPGGQNPTTATSDTSQLTTFYFYRLASAADAGSTATWSWGAEWPGSAIVADYSAVDPTQPFDGANVDSGTSRTARNGGVSTTAGGDTVTSWVASTAGRAFSLAAGPGQLEADETFQDRSAEWDAVQSTAGATGPYSWTMPRGSVQWVTGVIALRPVPAQQAPVITSAASTTFTIGEGSSFKVAASGLPVPALSEAGSLPAGVAFDGATGELGGTPAAGTAGAYRLTFTASNGVQPDAVQSFVLNVTASIGPTTSEHFSPNGNFDANGTYLPGVDGFNLADVSSSGMLPYLPSGVRALVYVGLCDGADANFIATVQPYVGQPSVFGFYLMDEPDPTGQYGPICTAANLKAESDWIHMNDPGAKTFIIMMNLSSSQSPNFSNGYNPGNTDLDLFGIDPYPCRTELSGCSYSMITKYVAAAEADGVPQGDIVPVFQAFGGGTWVDDGGGSYQLPTAAQEYAILSTWETVVPAPVFDYAYSWGSQRSDQSLAGSPSLQQVFATLNSQ